MNYNPVTKILTLSRDDLRRCGFVWEAARGELFPADMSTTEIDEVEHCKKIEVVVE